MLEAGFDKKLDLPSGSGMFVRLKKKDDKIKFRIANTPYYETIHWVNGKKVECGRFNAEDGAICQYCEDFEKAVDNEDEEAAREIRPQTNFYYPILNLNTGKPAIFTFMAKSIHYTIKGYADNDVDVFNCDWSVERTQEQGNYYRILHLSDKPLNEELQHQYDLAKKLKVKAKESNSIVLDDNDFPNEE